jgi:hypothetical protein
MSNAGRRAAFQSRRFAQDDRKYPQVAPRVTREIDVSVNCRARDVRTRLRLRNACRALEEVGDSARNTGNTRRCHRSGMPAIRGCRLPRGPVGGGAARRRHDHPGTPDRWNVEDHYDPEPGVPGRSISRRGAVLDDIAGFDPEHRLLLETGYSTRFPTSERSHYARVIASSNCGV